MKFNVALRIFKPTMMNKYEWKWLHLYEAALKVYWLVYIKAWIDTLYKVAKGLDVAIRKAWLTPG